MVRGRRRRILGLRRSLGRLGRGGVRRRGGGRRGRRRRLGFGRICIGWSIMSIGTIVYIDAAIDRPSNVSSDTERTPLEREEGPFTTG